MMLTKSMVPYLILGFILVAYLNVPIIGVALFGLVAALIYINKSSEAVKEAAYDDNEF